MDEKTTPTARDVEALARYLHANAKDVRRELGAVPELVPWGKLGELSQAVYRGVARRLLADPPDVMRRALR